MIHSMTVGDTREYTRIITKEDVQAFARVTADYNPAHFDEDYCKTTMFKQPIVHGMLVGSLFSKIFGLDYPGEGTIYVSQSLTFLKPVYPDQELTIRVTVSSLDKAKNRAYFTTDVLSKDNKKLLTGEAMLMPKKLKQMEE
jgi:acyl dehydratase